MTLSNEMQTTTSKQKSIRVMMIRNQLPLAGNSGTDEVVLHFVEFLRGIGCDLDFLSLDRYDHYGRPCRKLASAFRSPCVIGAPSHIRVGSVLLNTSLMAWAIYVEGCIARRLPKSLSQALNKLRIAHRIDGIFNGLPPKTFFDPPNDSDISFVSNKVRENRPDILIVDYAWLCPLFEFVPGLSNVLKVVLGHDLIHMRAASFKELGFKPDLPDWDARTEMKQLLNADVILLETVKEVEAVQPMAQGREVICVPLGIPHKERRDRSARDQCLFVGSNVPANISGLRWFLTEVWPLVLQQAPQSRLEVCGTVCSAFDGINYPGVQFLGRVESLTPNYERACVCIIPLLAGSGFKTKLIEALSYGCACVSTPVGAAGAESIIGTGILVAESPVQFASCTVALLKDDELRGRLEIAATRYAKENLSPDAVFRPLRDLILR